MRPITQTALQTLQRSHKRVARVSALDASFEPIPGGTLSGEQGYAFAGSVTIDRRRNVRRTCDLSVANPDGVWTPDDAGDFFFFGNAIRIERGIYLNESEIEWYTLGVFLIDTPTVDVGPAGGKLQVQGQDRMKRAVYSKFGAPTTYAVATPIRDVIADLALDAGMGGERIRLEDGGKTLAADRTYDSQEERVAAMVEVARDYSLDLYVDAEGFLVLEPIVALTQKPIAYEYTKDQNAVMLGITKGWSDQRLYNHVVVTGESADQSPVRAEASDLNPASPGYIFGPLGDRTYFYSSALITTVGQAQAVANTFLPEVALIEESIDLPTIVNPALEADDAIRIVEPVSHTDATYLIDSITIPLGTGSSRLQTKHVRPLA